MGTNQMPKLYVMSVNGSPSESNNKYIPDHFQDFLYTMTNFH
uniref:Uncharacterized protein n=1 Tax=Anguilla anguilla TaxID=7936 RepID=A0A0E9SSU5_ANGAN